MLLHHFVTLLKKDIFLCNQIGVIVTVNKIYNNTEFLKKPGYFFGSVLLLGFYDYFLISLK